MKRSSGAVLHGIWIVPSMIASFLKLNNVGEQIAEWMLIFSLLVILFFIGKTIQELRFKKGWAK